MDFVIFIIFVIMFLCAMFKGVTPGRRVASCIITVISTAVTLYGSNLFFNALESIDTNSIFMVFEYALVIFFGGLIWFLVFWGALWLCMQIAGFDW